MIYDYITGTSPQIARDVSRCQPLWAIYTTVHNSVCGMFLDGLVSYLIIWKLSSRFDFGFLDACSNRVCMLHNIIESVDSIGRDGPRTVITQSNLIFNFYVHDLCKNTYLCSPRTSMETIRYA